MDYLHMIMSTNCADELTYHTNTNILNTLRYLLTCFSFNALVSKLILSQLTNFPSHLLHKTDTKKLGCG